MSETKKSETKKNETKKNEIVIMDFSGIYMKEEFDVPEASWVDVRDISGTNCYCDDEAKSAIHERISDFSAEGIHFIDSGNYHYMSRIWLSKVKEPMSLLVFDNHTDMQLPAFGGILSCGGWIAASLEEVDNLRDVILIGPDEEAYSQVEPQFKERVKFLSREKLAEMSEKERTVFIREAVGAEQISLYISVDKDILCPGEADTSWSQGDLTLQGLISMLETAVECAKECGRDICGVDICGESEHSEAGNKEENVKANKVLLECLQRNKIF